MLRFATFEDLFTVIPLEKCGNDAQESIKEAVKGMRKYYSEEQEKKYGVVGIWVSLKDLESTLTKTGTNQGDRV